MPIRLDGERGPPAMTTLTNQDQKFWHPRPDVHEWLMRRIPDSAKVLDIGPGTAPFRRANMFVDWRKPNDLPESKFRRIDLNRDPLPFGDKAFDFAYCRHVLEDLYNPFLLCTEMARVAMAGYIQTPSPLAEVCRGVDGNSPSWRGYQHHRFLIWNRNGILCFLSKYPII
jgi:methyltransferase family protein